MADQNMPVFPTGLRVLLVDDDPTSLLELERLLSACHYQVTKCERASDALSLLRQSEGLFDIVMSEMYMPDMDGFQLLEVIGLGMDLPVVMMSSDDRKEVVMKTIMKGACDYLIKPVRMEEVRVIWQHVIRKRRNDLKSYLISKFVPSGDQEEDDQNFKTNSGDSAFEGNKNDNLCSNLAVKDEDKGHEDIIVSLKKPRMVWTSELHDQFVDVVNYMGLNNAVPKKILEHMKVPGLTRENVASHLQKYRLHHRRKNENSRQKLRVAHLPNIDQHPCVGDSCNSGSHSIPKQLDSQSSGFLQAEARRLSISMVGTPGSQRISYYDHRLKSESILEGGQQSWYYGTEVINHLHHQDHETPAMINAASEQDSSIVMQRFMQSSLRMEMPNELARDQALNQDSAAAVAAYVPISNPSTMSSFEDDIEDTQNESSFVVNSMDPVYGLCPRYEPIYLV